MSKATAKPPHLDAWPLTPWLKAAIAEIGVAEVNGAASNPRILEYRKMAGIPIGGDDGVVPWCAIFRDAMLSSVGVDCDHNAMARAVTGSAKFIKLAEPVVGCITVISSSRGPTTGHTFFYTGENGLFLQGIGGNQNDEVSISMFPKSKLVGHYWPRGVPLPASPFNKPVRLARPLLPHEKAVRDA